MDPRVKPEDDGHVRYVNVAVPLPLQDIYTYAVPEELASDLEIGKRVSVPFRNRKITAYVVGFESEQPPYACKDVQSVLDTAPVIDAGLLRLTRWISEYYGCGWGEAIENALPKWVKYGKKVQKYLDQISEEQKNPPAQLSDITRELTAEQKSAFSILSEELSSEAPKPCLLYGVTGSGKSELYIRLIRKTLEEGKSAICLVPEIALTEQLKRFFTDQFGSRMEMLHSKMTDAERFLAWKRIQLGVSRVVLGPRSAVFAPVLNLGAIIIDEEHDTSYKQETAPRYHARRVAEERTRGEGALLVCGSATPTFESMHAAQSDHYRLIRLTKRVDDKPLPGVRIIDLANFPNAYKKEVMFSPPLRDEIKKCISKKEGVMLLLNRRGFSNFIEFPEKKEIMTCESCDIPYTYHQRDDLLLCHYCDDRKKFSEVASNEPFIKLTGFGTERVESEAAMQFPGARIARLDTDVLKKKGTHEEILERFRNKEIDILIGTQMIAKGFDFEHVTLVGVIFADVGLKLPDFRAGERTFQLLTQVAGRAGRGKEPGKVFVQTLSPMHPSIQFAAKHDYDNFYDRHIGLREELRYPPFAGLMNIIVRSKDERKAYLYAKKVREVLKVFQVEHSESVYESMGPTPMPFYKLRDYFRWHVMLKLSPDFHQHEDLYRALKSIRKSSMVQVAYDMNPQSIL